jgi:hypothetical protein
VTLPPDVPVRVRVPVSGAASSVEFLQEGRPPVPLRQQGVVWVSDDFEPAQDSFTIRVDGQAPVECIGYVYTGGGGFVFADSGAPGNPKFQDGFENGIGSWRPGKWTIVTPGHMSEHSITDSPDGTYNQDDVNELYMPGPALDLRDVPAPQLSFWHEHHLARGDRAEVHIRAGLSGGWSTLKRFEDATSGWQYEVISLEEYARESEVEIKFVLDSDSRGPNDDGWYLDDVTVSPGGRLNGRYEVGEPLVRDAAVTLLQRNPSTGLWHVWDASLTGQTNPQVTDERGRYGFYNLPPGEYRIRVDSSAYGPALGEVVVVWDGTLEYQLPMALGEPLFLPLTFHRGRIP